jgi:hypothetical protein
MNEMLTGTTTEDRHVRAKARAWMRVNSESVSNEIDESEKHSEQTI